MVRILLAFFFLVCVLLPPDTAYCAVESESFFSTSLRVIWGLLIVLGILFIIYGVMKKKMHFLHMQGKGIIKIIEVRHLMPKKSLYLVEVRGREFLLGAGQNNIELIAPISPAANDSFADILESSKGEETR